MAYTPVTVNDFTTRFPQYATVSTTLLDALLLEAQAQVDETWIEEDFKPATLYYMAHLLVREQGGAASIDAPGTIVSESFGPISRTFAQPQGGSAMLTLSSTEYGRRFVELRKRNFPAIEVA